MNLGTIRERLLKKDSLESYSNSFLPSKFVWRLLTLFRDILLKAQQGFYIWVKHELKMFESS